MRPKCQAKFSAYGFPFQCTEEAYWLVEAPSGKRRLCCDSHLTHFVEWVGTNRATCLTDCCRCDDCLRDGPHASDCAVHNAPAYPKGSCSCALGEDADEH